MTEHGHTLLIIEDDADVRRAARIALSPSFARVDVAADAGALQDHLQARLYDAVLLDMNFVVGERSGSAGLEALSMIRAADPDLAVVLMTAYGGVALAVEGLKRGAADFILKPWHNEKLVVSMCAAATATRKRREMDPLNLDVVERATIERALVQHRGNISLAAAALGLSRPALYRRLSKYGLGS